MKQISVDKDNFELAWTRASPLILKALKELINNAIMTSEPHIDN